MSDMTTYFTIDTAAVEDPTTETTLSPRAKAFVIIGLALAAWVPILLPVFLILHR
jgi:hypothetical protein